MSRALYCSLIRLHPAAFRKQFGEDMLWIFDECAGGAASLMSDAFVSLARQWLIREGIWKVVAAALGGVVHMYVALDALSTVMPKW